ATSVLVFIRTSPFRLQDRQYARSITVPLRLPSSDTLRIVGAALMGLKVIFQSGYLYAKTGVMLLDLHPASVTQQELDLGGHDIETDRRHQRLM
ncbi:MAG: DNA polymerase V subunit UmuC, partial [Limnohabitans sp.]